MSVARLFRRRRAAAGGLTGRALMLGLVLVFAIVVLASPLHRYLVARGELAQARADRVSSARELAQLQAQKARWSDPAYVEQQAREQERARIARELHDELGQTLTAIKMDLVWMKDRLDEPALVSARIERLIALADRSVGDLRRIATELRPLILDELGLRAAIEWLTQSMAERSGLPITLVFDEGATYEPDVSTAAFRIVQEALTNVLRHGAATGVEVRARNVGDALLIEVSDNGRGIDRSATTGGRLGLAGMRERARLLGGSVAIDGAAGAGTTVRVCLPLERRTRRKAAR